MTQAPFEDPFAEWETEVGTLEDVLGDQAEGPIDMKALLVRRFVWDTTVCSDVAALMPKLGLVVGSEEGFDGEHRESHERMAAVLPLEAYLRTYAELLGTVLSTAMTERAGITEKLGEGTINLAEQTAEAVLAGSRAMIAQFFFIGLLGFGPAVQIYRMVPVEPAAPGESQEPGEVPSGDADGQLG